jgi:hypothetical protein
MTSEREKLIEVAKQMGFKEEDILSPEEHRELVRGKKIVFTDEFKRELEKLK